MYLFQDLESLEGRYDRLEYDIRSGEGDVLKKETMMLRFDFIRQV